MSMRVLLLSLLWSLVEVHSQTFPYVSFMDQTLANHSYVDLSLVGYDYEGSESVQCITDLATCCTGSDGSHRAGISLYTKPYSMTRCLNSRCLSQ